MTGVRDTGTGGETCQNCGGDAGDNHFDRSLCACGAMHYYCNGCGHALDDCTYESVPVSASGGPISDERIRLPRLRVGRKVGRTLYLQIGDEPSDDDALAGMMDSRDLALRVATAEAEISRLRAVLTQQEAALQEIVQTTNGRSWRNSIGWECERIARAALEGTQE